MEIKESTQFFGNVPKNGIALTVRNPIAVAEKEIEKPAARLADLSNKKIGLLWNSKARGDVALEQAEVLLKEKFSGLEFSWFKTGNSTALAPKELKILKAQKNDAFIATTGD